jgi:hypothetical protein
MVSIRGSPAVLAGGGRVSSVGESCGEPSEISRPARGGPRQIYHATGGGEASEIPKLGLGRGGGCSSLEEGEGAAR